jgi:hypothetical protein
VEACPKIHGRLRALWPDARIVIRPDENSDTFLQQQKQESATKKNASS